jgi:protein subunit release factor B
MNFPVDLSPPVLAKALEIGLRPEDTDEQFIRGSGHGGQKINKTASCVQLRHTPTGIEVRCQDHREQSKNRLSAWKLLILKLEERVKGKQSALAQQDFKLRKQKKRRSRRAKEKMIEDKRQRGDQKEMRRPLV